MPTSPPRRVSVVAHTHWDREWYAPFQLFRLGLVDALDDLLGRLGSDPGWSSFLLDGQMAALDDYLELRPGSEEEVRRLAGEGRLLLGPWYVLMDEFLVSGETILRNLELGLRKAGEFGGAMRVGYLPDMFGHIAQMPRILRLAGFDDAVVWRGVPASVDRHAFTWSSPGGASVRAEYLPVGYSAGAALPPDPDELLRRVQAYSTEVGPLYPDAGQPLLLMAGGDHQLPAAGLPSHLARANQAQEEIAFELTSLPAYLAAAPDEGLPAWEGELRSGARANLLMGVASNRVDVKQAAARAERALERLAEPLAATWLAPERWPGTALAAAWRLLVLNSAHDSICACSADTVGQAVLERYAEATAIAEGVTAQALDAAADTLPEGSHFVLNSWAGEKGGLIELDLGAEVAPEGFQLVSSRPAGNVEVTGCGRDLARLLGELTEGGWLADGKATAAAVRAGPDGVVLDLELDPAAPGGRLRRVDQAMAEAWAQAGSHPDAPLTVRAGRRASVHVAARVAGVPGFGWAPLVPDLAAPPVETGPLSLDNGLVRVEVDPVAGTFSVGGLAGLDRLVDGGDAGDTYNYSPPEHDTVVDRPVAVLVQPGEPGPVRGTLLVTRDYVWPAQLDGQSRDAAVGTRVATRLELRAGEELVRVATTLHNASRDHRLRAHFPLPAAATSSRAECAFALVERGLEAEGGRGERALATMPSRRFVTAGGLFLTHEGLLEYELVEDGRELAVTLLRCTGILSRPAPAWRPNAAGPALPVEGPQMQGPITLRYAVSTSTGDPYALADQAWLDLLPVAGRCRAAAARPVRGTNVDVRGGQVSALRRVDGDLELRAFNPSDHATQVHLEGNSGWLVDLTGKEIGRWDGTIPVAPWEIITARITPR